MRTVCEATGGEEGMLRVIADEVVSHAFSTASAPITPRGSGDVPASLSIPKWSWDGLVE